MSGPFDEEVRICGAEKGDGAVCYQPAMPNGKCRMHGGKTPGAAGSSMRTGLYRKKLEGEEQKLYDALLIDTNFSSVKHEIALMRVVINRLAGHIIDDDERWRVPTQVLPQYMEKLLKLLDRAAPQASHMILEDNLDGELAAMMNEERASAMLKQDSKLDFGEQ